MELVLKNPFRVLGVPATSTSREIAKRISDLEMFAELGKIKSYPYDFMMFGDIDRSEESIKDAARKIESAEGRLLHSFFWFRSSDSVDELALDSLSYKRVDEAIDLWSKQIDKTGSEHYTWRLNRSVALFLQSTVSASISSSDFDRALEDVGYLIDDYLDESIGAVLAGNEIGLTRDRLCKNIIDELLDFIKKSTDQPYGKGLVGLLDSFWSFSESMRSYTFSKIINPLTEDVKDAIVRSEELRKDNNEHALNNKNYLEGVEWIVTELYEILGDDDVRLQSLANAYVEEILACSIQAYNYFEDSDLANFLVQWADELPSYGRIKESVDENKSTLKELIEENHESEIYAVIAAELKKEITTIGQASDKADILKVELQRIKVLIGGADERHTEISSICVRHILNFLIDSVNDAQHQFSINKKLDQLKIVISSAFRIMQKMRSLTMDDELSVHFVKNFQVIERINLETSSLQQGGGGVTSNNKVWAWVVIIIVVLLFAMCSD